MDCSTLSSLPSPSPSGGQGSDSDSGSNKRPALNPNNPAKGTWHIIKQSVSLKLDTSWEALSEINAMATFKNRFCSLVETKLNDVNEDGSHCNVLDIHEVNSGRRRRHLDSLLAVSVSYRVVIDDGIYAGDIKNIPTLLDNFVSDSEDSGLASNLSNLYNGMLVSAALESSAKDTSVSGKDNGQGNSDSDSDGSLSFFESQYSVVYVVALVGMLSVGLYTLSKRLAGRNTAGFSRMSTGSETSTSNTSNGHGGRGRGRSRSSRGSSRGDRDRSGYDQVSTSGFASNDDVETGWEDDWGDLDDDWGADNELSSRTVVNQSKQHKNDGQQYTIGTMVEMPSLPNSKRNSGSRKKKTENNLSSLSDSTPIRIKLAHKKGKEDKRGEGKSSRRVSTNGKMSLKISGPPKDKGRADSSSLLQAPLQPIKQQHPVAARKLTPASEKQHVKAPKEVDLFASFGMDASFKEAPRVNVTNDLLSSDLLGSSNLPPPHRGHDNGNDGMNTSVDTSKNDGLFGEQNQNLTNNAPLTSMSLGMDELGGGGGWGDDGEDDLDFEAELDAAFGE